MELRRVSKLFRICSKFPDGDLYKFTMPIVQRGRYNLTIQASKSFSLQNLCTFMLENLVTHSINTRSCSDLYLTLAYLTKVQKGVYHSGIRIFNCLPAGIKSLSGDVRKFKLALKRFLLEGSFYTIQEYFDCDILSNPS